ncbi:polyphosphate polymerase domain-containing protein [Bradyrhizobium guangdongense]|uniref:polyphosphate polymerase domain-containing protein n=1 Tax=Bradyrhizobium guangdongense TaxID=1325090 RepID=UPI001642453F|nr:polyphosphate polymerase domain-containing protein [Bradyrhizobium guangdongense]
MSGSKQPGTVAGARYEYKCVVEMPVGLRLLNRLGAFMRPDRNTTDERGYVVTSLYFDTPGLSHYHDVVSGELRRVKLRLRKYHWSSEQVVLEAKHKLNRMSWKDRLTLDRAKALDVVANPFGHADDPALAPFTMHLARERYAAVVAVAYRRIALSEIVDRGFRVTLDFDMRAGKPEMFDREWSRSDLRMIPPGLAVLELKCRDRMPSWCARALEAEQVSAAVFSKYINAVDRCHNFTPKLSSLYKGALEWTNS